MPVCTRNARCASSLMDTAWYPNTFGLMVSLSGATRPEFNPMAPLAAPTMEPPVAPLQSVSPPPSTEPGSRVSVYRRADLDHRAPYDSTLRFSVALALILLFGVRVARLTTCP